jgi:hypothetical protein
MTLKLDLLLPYIDPETLPWDYRELVEIVGLEKTLEIAARVGKTHMYMESLDNILLPAKREYVLDQRKKTLRGGADLNVRQIARDMDLSQETVYAMFRQKDETKDAGWKQESLI